VFPCLSWRGGCHDLAPGDGAERRLPAGIRCLASPCPHGRRKAAWPGGVTWPCRTSPFMTPAVGGTVSKKCCGLGLPWCGLTLLTSRKSGGGDGNRWGEGRWGARGGLGAARALACRCRAGVAPWCRGFGGFQQLLPQRGQEGDGGPVMPRAPGSALPSSASCLSWDGASHGSSSPSAARGDRSQLCEGFGTVAVYRRLWDAGRGDPGKDETRQLSTLPERDGRFGARRTRRETAGLDFCTSLSVWVDSWGCAGSPRVSEPWAAALCCPLPAVPRPSRLAWLPPPTSGS